MIDKIGGSYELTCDICGETAEETFCGFYEAVYYKKDEGWKSEKIKGDWQDICPDCQDEGKDEG
mgnify:CR=1 FL=1